jgi:hypothetical protein
MGLFGLFGKDKPSEAAIAKQVTRVKEQYAKPEYRQMAMDKLLEWGDKPSLKGLLNRFSVVVQSPHYDEEEKRWLADELAKRGDLAKEVLVDFLQHANEVSYAILALSKLSSEQELTSILISALQARSPEDHRSSQSKMELIAALEEREAANLGDLLIPYLDDHNDDVKCIAMDVIAAKNAEQAYPKIAQMLCEDQHSARVLRHAAAMVCKMGIAVSLAKPLTQEVAEDFVVKDGKLKQAH